MVIVCSTNTSVQKQFQLYYFLLTYSICGLLQMASYYKQVAVVAESICCPGQETEQHDNCSSEFNLK